MGFFYRVTYDAFLHRCFDLLVEFLSSVASYYALPFGDLERLSCFGFLLVMVVSLQLVGGKSFQFLCGRLSAVYLKAGCQLSLSLS